MSALPARSDQADYRVSEEVVWRWPGLRREHKVTYGKVLRGASRAGGTLRGTPEQLAIMWGCSTSAVSRRVRRLEAARLVIIERDSGQLEITPRLVGPRDLPARSPRRPRAIGERDRQRSLDFPEEAPRLGVVGVERASATGCTSTSATGCTSFPPQTPPYKEPRNNPPPPSKCFSNDTTSAPVWGAAAAFLRKLGVRNRRMALVEAQAHGLGEAHVVALCEHFASRPGAWGAGALVYMIQQAIPPGPDERVEEWAASGWPDPSESYLHRQHEARRAAQERQERGRAAREEAAGDDLENRYGSILDAMARVEQDALAARVLTHAALKTYQRRGVRAKSIRPTLLEVLALDRMAKKPR